MAKLRRLSAETDHDLCKRVRDSDAEAFRTCFCRYYEPLYRFVGRRAPKNEAPEDLVQEVFAKVWQRRATLDPKQSLKAYLFSTANNMLIDLYRKNEVRQRYQAEKRLEDTSIAPVENFDVDEHVQAAIQRLSPKVRETFILSRFDELTYPEIAALQGVSVKAIEKRMSQALRMLREALRDYLVRLIPIFWLLR